MARGLDAEAVHELNGIIDVVGVDVLGGEMTGTSEGLDDFIHNNLRRLPTREKIYIHIVVASNMSTGDVSITTVF